MAILTADKRAHVAGKYMFRMEGLDAGWVNSVEGGHGTAEVVVEKLGADVHQRKHLGPLKYEDISVVCGTGMSKAFYQWLQNSFEKKYSRQKGSIVAADYNFEAISEIEFHEALITEFGMPALDAASKDPAKMTVKFSPEYTRFKKGSGKINAPTKAEVQKRWLPSNFRITINGLEDACKKVNKIEALVMKQKVVDDVSGETRDYLKMPAHLETPNVVFTVAESHAEAVYQWHEDFVIKGNCEQKAEKSGSIVYLTPDLKTELFTVELINLGIFKLTPDKAEAGNEQIRRLKVEMYCEEMKFKYAGNACM